MAASCNLRCITSVILRYVNNIPVKDNQEETPIEWEK